MFKKISQLKALLGNLRTPVEYRLDDYSRLVDEINMIKLSTWSDNQLKLRSIELKQQVAVGAALEPILVEAFALVREASRRVLGIIPFDQQLMAGIALHKGKIVDMKTGEGKTLAAVMPAYLNALTGQGVHILTFNDYLAHRDATWMGPIYQFLGMRVSYVQEGQNFAERQQAYEAEITYLTAKEAGFDYLRDFICQNKAEQVHRPFHFAIIDEADSILIDEARIPLVIAGKVSGEEEYHRQLADIARSLQPAIHYELDQAGSNISLTEAGLLQVEADLGCGNLYAPANLGLLIGMNCALQAEVLLQKDRDYIVRKGQLELVDAFTGRVAAQRHWPDNLQTAVEAKEAIETEGNGKLLGTIALQHFLSLYPKLAGMTGTALPAAKEFGEFYGREVVVIPTNQPCKRVDHPDWIFTKQETKQQALLAEIQRIHATGQPVLIGTGSIKESENLALDLRKLGINCQVLNAKNDQQEAKIIAGAGALGAVTVSTNMAGRGIDIKLGGVAELERDQVIALGGLHILATNRQESRRIDEQLIGRAGRQGDPGESRFLISLEDDLIQKHASLKSVAKRLELLKQQQTLNNPGARQEFNKIQRSIEAYYSDNRRQLWRYAYILEQQRRIIHSKRQQAMLGEVPQVCYSKAAERYLTLLEQVGEPILQQVEQQLTLYYINKCWSEYLDYIGYVREGVHLVVIGGQDPLTEFHKHAITGFDLTLAQIDTQIVEKFRQLTISADGGFSLEQAGLKGPSSTWTYLIDDRPDQFSNLANVIKKVTTTFSGPLFSVRSLYKRLLDRKRT